MVVPRVSGVVRPARRRRVRAVPISRTTAPIAMRCQAMSSGPRSVRSATIRPLTPEVPQQSAARTTRRNPRRDAGEARGEDMTLLDRFRVGDSDPEHGMAAGGYVRLRWWGLMP